MIHWAHIQLHLFFITMYPWSPFEHQQIILNVVLLLVDSTQVTTLNMHTYEKVARNRKVIILEVSYKTFKGNFNLQESYTFQFIDI